MPLLACQLIAILSSPSNCSQAFSQLLAIPSTPIDRSGLPVPPITTLTQTFDRPSCPGISLLQPLRHSTAQVFFLMLHALSCQTPLSDLCTTSDTQTRRIASRTKAPQRLAFRTSHQQRVFASCMHYKVVIHALLKRSSHISPT